MTILLLIEDIFKSQKYHNLEKLETIRDKKKNLLLKLQSGQEVKKSLGNDPFFSTYIISLGYDELNYILLFYQQPGDAKNPYFAQYSAV